MASKSRSFIFTWCGKYYVSWHFKSAWQLSDSMIMFVRWEASLLKNAL